MSKSSLKSRFGSYRPAVRALVMVALIAVVTGVARATRTRGAQRNEGLARALAARGLGVDQKSVLWLELPPYGAMRAATSRDLFPASIDAADDLPNPELSANLPNASRQQAMAAIHECLHGARVQAQLTAAAGGEGEPVLAARHAFADGEEGAHGLASECAAQRVAAATVADDGGCVSRRGGGAARGCGVSAGALAGDLEEATAVARRAGRPPPRRHLVVRPWR